ncbi:AAC(3) family N-acetyltransferase [Candidatus Poribacteria bacterium]|nr:AAC(3) family N-acetyltransferase [Candidatus Poribacteria bacterium]MYH79821.1 AAC(3) family N-acetyltransferase [Candidatus Poribacteria bacterium]MYK95123.1 AAC(3) family N-acetyltransferase [Candidatus Poribacteria bacterium]
MSEGQAVRKVKTPTTVESLQTDFRALGIEKGMVLLVHSSLSAMGWVCGGAVAVIIALQQVLEETGTLVMPAHSTDLSDPSQWKNPPVPESWWETIRETMPAYDPDLTPTRSMGKIAETFRKQKDIFRSAHPQSSFCARGPQASYIVKNHALAYGMGEHSPLARIYDLQGYVLLLGVDHSSNTSIHLAEYRAGFPSKRVVQEGAPISQTGSRSWTTFEDIDVDDSDFDRLGEDFLRSDAGKVVERGKVGIADCQLMPQRTVVDFAVDWFEKNRGR